MTPATEVELMRWRLLIADLTDRLEARARTLAHTPDKVRERDRHWIALRHRLAQAQAAEPKAHRPASTQNTSISRDAAPRKRTP